MEFVKEILNASFNEGHGIIVVCQDLLYSIYFAMEIFPRTADVVAPMEECFDDVLFVPLRALAVEVETVSVVSGLAVNRSGKLVLMS